MGIYLAHNVSLQPTIAHKSQEGLPIYINHIRSQKQREMNMHMPTTYILRSYTL